MSTVVSDWIYKVTVSHMTDLEMRSSISAVDGA